jgi:adenylate cyclase
MLRRLSILLPMAILVFALGLRYADPPAVERLRLAVFDEYQRLKPRAWAEADVRVIDIDDASLDRLGQWPWPRTLLAELVDRLGDLGTAVVAFDIVFSEPDRTSPSRIVPLWRRSAGSFDLDALLARLPDHDREFARVMGEVPTVLAMQLTDGQVPRRPARKWGIAVAGDDPRPFLPVFRGAVTNLPELETAAAGLGSFNSSSDRDGIIRHVPLFVRLKGDDTVTDEVYPSLAAEALRVAQGGSASTYTLKTSGASGQASFGAHTGMVQARIGQMIVPTDSQGRIWLYDTGPIPERFIPAWEVLERGFDRQRLDGKIVLVGTSAAGLKDLRATPLNPVAPGVEVHAQALEQMILGEFLDRPDWMTGAEFLWLLAFGSALALLLSRWGAGWCAIVAGGGIALTAAGSWLAFTLQGWLVDPVYPALAVLLLYLTQSFLQYLRTETERRQVRGAFGRYLSPAVVERLARDPGSLRLGGETRPMTLMFCDIRGFTAISETLEAGELTSFINGFLTPMTDIILEHGGTIDKYMGDAIMAFWNAPLDDPDHASNAARAALAMTQSLGVLNNEWQAAALAAGRPYRTVAIGVGLNTGACCVGNVGSEQRFDYSVLGDTVNLASRLEGQSKTYGVSIVAGADTVADSPELAWLELDLIRVKGKDRAVRIFALLGDEAVAGEPWYRLARMAQAEMLDAYRAQEWSRARAALERVRVAAGGQLDDLCDLFERRLERFTATPPDAAWDGVYAAAEK